MKPNLTCRTITAMSVLVVLCAGPVSKVQGAVIESRSDLNSQLGPNAVTEGFESYLFPADTARRVGTVLDSSSVIEGQGPGLVVEGVRFVQSDRNGEGLQWDRQTQSAAMVTDGKLIVDFTIPTTHFGLDMFWFDVGFPLAHPATVQVYGADDVSLNYSVNIFEPFAPNSRFFGFADNGGIGRVVLFRDEGESEGVSPIIDNLTFGFTPVPEPGTLTLALLGLGGCLILRWKKKS